MMTFWIIIAWVLPSVVMGGVAGFLLGKNHRPEKDAEDVQQQKRATLKALRTILKSAQRLTEDMGSHQHELEEVERHVQELDLGTEFAEVQQEFIGQITTVVESNRRLSDDLTCTRFRLQQQEVELDRTRAEARTDELSGVANRKAFDETLEYLMASFKREQRPFAMVLCDVDHFKWINDTHGHAAGDEVVTRVGKILSDCVRAGDFVSRYGGDEFALFFTDDAVKVAPQIADRIRTIVEQRNWELGDDRQQAAVTFSMGLTVVREGDTIQSFFDRADRALYQSKRSGRNQLHCATQNEQVEKFPGSLTQSA